MKPTNSGACSLLAKMDYCGQMVDAIVKLVLGLMRRYSGLSMKIGGATAALEGGMDWIQANNKTSKNIDL